MRTENGGVEFHTHGNRKLRNSFHTYDNRKVCPSFNLFLKSTFSLTLGKNNGTALVVWQPTAGRDKGWLLFKQSHIFASFYFIHWGDYCSTVDG